MLGTGKQQHTAAASWGHPNFGSVTNLWHLKASHYYHWHCLRIRGTEELGDVMAGRLGRDTWWKSQYISVVINSSSPIPIQAQQEQESPVLCKYIQPQSFSVPVFAYSRREGHSLGLCVHCWEALRRLQANLNDFSNIWQVLLQRLHADDSFWNLHQCIPCW